MRYECKYFSKFTPLFLHKHLFLPFLLTNTLLFKVLILYYLKLYLNIVVLCKKHAL